MEIIINFLAVSSESDFDNGIIEIVIGILITIIILFYLAIMVIIYKKITLPTPFYRNGVSSKLTAVEISKQYLAKRGINDIGVKSTLNHSHPFGNYSKNEILINNLPVYKIPYQLTGLGLDYALGRTFLSIQQHLHNYEYWLYRIVLFFLPIVFFVLYWIFFIINLTIGIIAEINPYLLIDVNFIKVVFDYKMPLIIQAFCFSIYIVLSFVGPWIKQKIEDDYDAEILSYVKTNFLDLYSDFLFARKYSKSIRSPFVLGIGWLLKNNYRYLGPFGYF